MSWADNAEEWTRWLRRYEGVEESKEPVSGFEAQLVGVFVRFGVGAGWGASSGPGWESGRELASDWEALEGHNSSAGQVPPSFPLPPLALFSALATN